MLVLKTPKTITSVRRVYLPPSVAKMLVDWKKQQDEAKEALGAEYQDYGLVFAGPFGHGLSYTCFSYSNLRVSSDCLRNGETLDVMLDVTNTGSMAGSEIVQIYVSDPESYMPRPMKELKGFSRVWLELGDTKTVAVQLNERAFSYYVPHLERYAVESGTFRILAGASSKDIRIKKEITFISEDEVRLPLGMDDSLGDFFWDSRYTRTTREVYAQLEITEDCPMFPILESMTLKNLPGVLRYIQV